MSIPGFYAGVYSTQQEYDRTTAVPTPSNSARDVDSGHLLGQIYRVVQQQQADFQALKDEAIGRIQELSCQVSNLQEELKMNQKNPRGRRLKVPKSVSVS